VRHSLPRNDAVIERQLHLVSSVHLRCPSPFLFAGTLSGYSNDIRMIFYVSGHENPRGSGALRHGTFLRGGATDTSQCEYSARYLTPLSRHLLRFYLNSFGSLARASMQRFRVETVCDSSLHLVNKHLRQFTRRDGRARLPPESASRASRSFDSSASSPALVVSLNLPAS